MSSADVRDVITHTSERSASIVHIDTSKLLPTIILIGLVAVAAGIGSAIAWDRASQARTEARMAEYYITRLDALMVERGIKSPGDDFTKFKATYKE